MIKEIHIFDVDGTLVDSSHRYRLNNQGKIDLQYWIDNTDKMLEDKPLPLARKFRRVVKNPRKFAVIATARIWCPLSVAFAYAANLEPNGLTARRNRNDRRPGAKIKTSYVDKLLNLKQFKQVEEIHIYEDNKDYLFTIMNHYLDKGFKVHGHFFPSNQGF